MQSNATPTILSEEEFDVVSQDDLGRPARLPLDARFSTLLREAIDSTVASNRYRLFGRKAPCSLPTTELSMHFLDRGESSPGSD
jgi:hypothetical protein